MSSEVHNSRVIDCPRDLVWRAWAEPEHLTKWFGPNGFTSTFHEFNFCEGGDWKFIFHGPDGKNYNNHSKFREIKKPERIVYEHISVPEYQGTITFEDHSNISSLKGETAKTKVSFTQCFPKAIEEKFRAFLNEKNEENLDRLEAELKRMKFQGLSDRLCP